MVCRSGYGDELGTRLFDLGNFDALLEKEFLSKDRDAARSLNADAHSVALDLEDSSITIFSPALRVRTSMRASLVVDLDLCFRVTGLILSSSVRELDARLMPVG